MRGLGGEVGNEWRAATLSELEMFNMKRVNKRNAPRAGDYQAAAGRESAPKHHHGLFSRTGLLLH